MDKDTLIDLLWQVRDELRLHRYETKKRELRGRRSPWSLVPLGACRHGKYDRDDCDVCFEDIVRRSLEDDRRVYEANVDPKPEEE